MLFNSYLFILFFLPTALLATATFPLPHNGVPDLTRRKSILLVISISFYGWYYFPFIFLLLFSILFNYGTGAALGRYKEYSKGLIFFGVAVNLLLLGYYKYYNFFIDQLNLFFQTGYSAREIILPLAISFFTFQQISYLVDLHQVRTRQGNFLDYCLFVSFFPQLIAGPICRHRHLAAQIEKGFHLNGPGLQAGISIFVIGLAKKVLIADNLAILVEPLYLNPSGTDFFQAWFAALLFSFQIYFDFSGYTDMAIGLGRMFGIRLPENFQSPFQARSIIDFWRRWHMTLSEFLKDYLYIPLGGNRVKPSRQLINLMITMLIGGLWHGAKWTFVLWGGLHGLFLAINHLGRSFTSRWAGTVWLGKLAAAGSWTLTFGSVVFAFVVFRSDNIGAAVDIWQGMLGLKGMVLPVPGFLASRFAFLSELGITLGGQARDFLMSLGAAAGVMLLVFMPARQLLMERIEHRRFGTVYISLLFVLAIISLNRQTPFIYFNF